MPAVVPCVGDAESGPEPAATDRSVDLAHPPASLARGRGHRPRALADPGARVRRSSARRAGARRAGRGDPGRVGSAAAAALATDQRAGGAVGQSRPSPGRSCMGRNAGPRRARHRHGPSRAAPRRRPSRRWAERRARVPPHARARRSLKERLMRVIDMECNVPKLTSGDAPAVSAAAAPPASAAAPSAAERPAGYGMANYERIFRSRAAGGDPRPNTEISEYVKMLDRIGIVRAVPFGATNDEVAELLADYPERFI